MSVINEKLCLIIPVYNEEGAISEVISDWTKKLKSLKIEFKICAYNDGSKDRTLDILEEISIENEFLEAIDKKNSGHGPTILKGYKDNLDAKWLFQIDSDNELKAANFDLLWEARNDNDFVIGNRKDRRSPLARVVITLISRLVVAIFYGNKVIDVNVPYRLMRVACFKDDIVKIPNNTFAPNLIIAGIASKNKLKIAQFDIPHYNRQTGEVSIKKWKLLKAAFQSFKQTILFRFQS